jgi:hypothetical protein
MGAAFCRLVGLVTLVTALSGEWAEAQSGDASSGKTAAQVMDGSFPTVDPNPLGLEPIPTVASSPAGSPPVVRAQSDTSTGYAPGDPEIPLPIGAYGGHPEAGGIFVYYDFVMYRETNPLRNQSIAVRGFVDTDGSITGSPGTFVGSGAQALNARNASGPDTYQPGFKTGIGYRFDGESAPSVSLDWMWLADAKYNANATLTPPFLQVGPRQENSFLFSPVYNFPNDYAGPPNKIQGGGQFAAYGIWNGASNEAIQFVQRVNQLNLTYRQPFFETECYRISGLAGGRFFWIWENFQWTTQSLDSTGTAGPLDTAVFTNIVSKRTYGPSIGLDQEWYIGHGFAVHLDCDTAVMLDVAREKIQYELAFPKAPPISKIGRIDYAIVPQFDVNVSMMWYVTDAIQLRGGFDGMLFLNTLAAQQPVNFDWGAPAYQYNHVVRWFDGIFGDISIRF